MELFSEVNTDRILTNSSGEVSYVRDVAPIYKEKKFFDKHPRLRKGVRTLLLLLAGVGPVRSVANTVGTSTAIIQKAFTGEVFTTTPESEILNSPERLRACNELVLSLSGSELAGGALDNVSVGHYEKAMGIDLSGEYRLTKQDIETLLAVEIADRSGLVDAGLNFIEKTAGWGRDASADDYRQAMTESGMPASAIAYVCDGDPNGLQKRVANVKAELLFLKAQMEKLAFANQFFGTTFGARFHIMDPRVTVGGVWSSLEANNNKDSKRYIREMIKNKHDYQPVWVSAQGGLHTGHFNFINKAGELALWGVKGPDGTSIVYVYADSNGAEQTAFTLPTLRDAELADVSLVKDRAGWWDRFRAAFHIDINVTVGVGIGVGVGGGQSNDRWRPSDVEWNQVSWVSQDTEWYTQSHGFVWDNTWYSTAAERAAWRAEKAAEIQSRPNYTPTKTPQGNRPGNYAPGNQQPPIQVKGNAPGGRGLTKPQGNIKTIRGTNYINSQRRGY